LLEFQLHNMEKEKCDCGDNATWCYLPSTDLKLNPYYCDNCVPRGCSCEWNSIKDGFFPEGIENIDWKWLPARKAEGYEIEENECWVPLDEKQREYPCCEYDYDENGYEKE